MSNGCDHNPAAPTARARSAALSAGSFETLGGGSRSVSQISRRPPRHPSQAADFSSVQSGKRFSSSAQAPFACLVIIEEIELTICSRSGPTTATSSQGVTQVVLVLSHIIRWRSRGVMSPGFPSKLHSRWVRSSGSRLRSSRSPLIMVGFFSSHFYSLDHGPSDEPGKDLAVLTLNRVLHFVFEFVPTRSC